MRTLPVALLLSASVSACGGPTSKTPPTNSSVDAGPDAATLPSHLVSTLPTDVRNPPPYHLGSKHAERKPHPEWSACHVAFQPTADPVKSLDALASGCAAVTRMHAVGTPMTGTQNAISTQPITYKLHAEGKHCYRVYGVAGPGVKSLVAVVTDDAGAEIAEYHTDDVTPFFAPDEALCFSDDDDARIIASVGIGDGPYALSVWGD